MELIRSSETFVHIGLYGAISLKMATFIDCSPTIVVQSDILTSTLCRIELNSIMLYFTGIFVTLVLSSALASPYKRAQLRRAQNANNFVGENTNELATAILQVSITLIK
jgi:hypothetical protein